MPQPPAARTGLESFGVHAERIWLAVIIGIAGAVAGVMVMPRAGEAALGVVFGVFAAAIALWAPSARRLVAGLVLLAIDAGLMLVLPAAGLLLISVPLAMATSPGIGVAWLGHAFGVAIPVSASVLLFGLVPKELAAVAISAVALAAVLLSQRIGAVGRARS